MREIVVNSAPNSVQSVVLDGLSYRFEFVWNSRGEYWTLSIRDEDNNSLLSGMKLVSNYELISLYPDRGLPQGELYVIDNYQSGQKPDRTGFRDGRYTLVYIEESEL